MTTGLTGISAIANAAARMGVLPNRADIDLRDRILWRLRELTGQDNATLIAYLNRRAVASPLPTLTSWLQTEHDIMVAYMDSEPLDWSA